jgi:hypothetical protein
VTRTQVATQALKDGTVRRAGWTLNFEEVPVLIQAFRRMVRTLDFDVTEMAFTTYFVAKAHGKPFTALPVFLVRGFHHGAIVRAVKSDGLVPTDLEGRRVGVNRGYTVTTGVDDLGTHGDAVVDYPPLCAAIGRLVAGGSADRDIVIGGSGSGEQIAGISGAEIARRSCMPRLVSAPGWALRLRRSVGGLEPLGGPGGHAGGWPGRRLQGPLRQTTGLRRPATGRHRRGGRGGC